MLLLPIFSMPSRNYFKVLLLLFSLTAAPFLGSAQELNVNIIIDDEQVQVSERDVFTEMRTNMMAFLNNRRWTSDVFTPAERINCNILISLKKANSQTSFEATAQIQSSRPIFNTNQQTLLLNYFDKNFNFEYTRGQPLDYNDNTYSTNLTSMLAFYAYIILGMDYDSFSNLGGTPFFEKARNIVNTAQSAGGGWDAMESTNNRYWLAENLNNQQVIPLREGMYIYHRKGMDEFLITPEETRTEILTVLSKVKSVNAIKPYSVVIKSFFSAKVDELGNVFSQATDNQKQQAYNILRELDPLNAEKYRKALKL